MAINQRRRASEKQEKACIIQVKQRARAVLRHLNALLTLRSIQGPCATVNIYDFPRQSRDTSPGQHMAPQFMLRHRAARLNPSISK